MKNLTFLIINQSRRPILDNEVISVDVTMKYADIMEALEKTYTPKGSQ
jgi:predicted thioredoxin/glutaredoxin